MFESEWAEVRLTPECRRAISELLHTHPDIYETESHIIRCAVMKLYRDMRNAKL